MTKEDRILFKDHIGSTLLLLFILSIGTLVLVLIFAWSYLFSSEALHRAVSWSFALIPVGILLIVALFKGLDLLVGRKRVISGVVSVRKRNFYYNNSGKNTTFFKVQIDNKNYSVNGGDYRKLSEGSRATLHQSSITRTIFLVEIEKKSSDQPNEQRKSSLLH